MTKIQNYHQGFETEDTINTFFGVIDINTADEKFYVIRYPFNDQECATKSPNNNTDVPIPWSHFEEFDHRSGADEYAQKLELADIQRLEKVDEKVNEVISLLISLPKVTIENTSHIKKLLAKIQASVLM